MNEKKGCVICKGELVKIKTKFKDHPIDAYKCKKCNEEFFNPEQAENILENMNEKKLVEEVMKYWEDNSPQTPKKMIELAIQKTREECEKEIASQIFTKDELSNNWLEQKLEETTNRIREKVKKLSGYAQMEMCHRVECETDRLISRNDVLNILSKSKGRIICPGEVKVVKEEK